MFNLFSNYILFTGKLANTGKNFRSLFTEVYQQIQDSVTEKKATPTIQKFQDSLDRDREVVLLAQIELLIARVVMLEAMNGYEFSEVIKGTTND